MRLLMDENVRPAHASALEGAGHDIRRSDRVLEKGVSDEEVLRAARERDRVLLTYDRKDFADTSDHHGVLIADETLPPRTVRHAIRRIEAAYPALDGVVDFLSDWA